MGRGCITAELIDPDELVSGIITRAAPLPGPPPRPPSWAPAPMRPPCLRHAAPHQIACGYADHRSRQHAVSWVLVRAWQVVILEHVAAAMWNEAMLESCAVEVVVSHWAMCYHLQPGFVTSYIH